MNAPSNDYPKSEIRKPKSPLTDSPWFWVMKFSLAAVAAATAMSLKYDRRQGMIEQNYQARSRVAERLTAENNSPDPLRIEGLETQRVYSTPGQRLIPIWPLATGLSVVATFAGLMLFRERGWRALSA